jgi:hypothetical protein
MVSSAKVSGVLAMGQLDFVLDGMLARNVLNV